VAKKGFTESNYIRRWKYKSSAGSRLQLFLSSVRLPKQVLDASENKKSDALASLLCLSG
jgi:hypothetical protein